MTTLANLLRKRKTASEQLSTYSSRALQGAVTEKIENQINSPDFDTTENIELFKKTQFDLRKIKTTISQHSSKTMVKIPEGTPVPESGTEVSLFQAILIRDDLKGQKNLLERLSKTESGKEKVRSWTISPNTEDIREKVRNFDFDKVITEMDSLQEHIDAVDACIQFTDNAVHIAT